MKTFTEWLKLREWDPVYPSDRDLGIGPSFNKVLGEDHDDPYSVEIHYDGEKWSVVGSLFVVGYVTSGSELPASEPRPFASRDGKKGVEFTNPGDQLENIHQPLRSQIEKWIDSQVEFEIENRDYE